MTKRLQQNPDEQLYSCKLSNGATVQVWAQDLDEAETKMRRMPYAAKPIFNTLHEVR